MKISRDAKRLLESEKLCVMGTSCEDKPYLSLMCFTYIEAENKVILSSRINSKKYDNVLKNKNISLLIFSSLDEVSATFLGTALTMEASEESYYRELHLQNNKMSQFIKGHHIGLIVFDIEEIILSNSQDEVKIIKTNH